MDFNQVRYFLTRAAEQCYVSQPALTQAIKRLETELGGELIRRDGRYTELTDLGKSLRGYFEQIDRTRHLLRTTAKAVTSGEIAELNIGLMCTIGPRVLGGMLDTFRMEHPAVSIVLQCKSQSVLPPPATGDDRPIVIIERVVLGKGHVVSGQSQHIITLLFGQNRPTGHRQSPQENSCKRPCID